MRTLHWCPPSRGNPKAVSSPPEPLCRIHGLRTGPGSPWRLSLQLRQLRFKLGGPALCFGHSVGFGDLLEARRPGFALRAFGRIRRPADKPAMRRACARPPLPSCARHPFRIPPTRPKHLPARVVCRPIAAARTRGCIPAGDLMVAAVEHRFGQVKQLPLPIGWLSDNETTSASVRGPMPRRSSAPCRPGSPTTTRSIHIAPRATSRPGSSSVPT